MKNTDFWFLLKTYVYVKIADNSLLLYNTENGEHIETDYTEAISLIKGMHKPENLGVIFLDKDIYNQPKMHEFISVVLSKGFGDLVNVNEVDEKPICLLPMLNLQRDVDKLDKKRISEDVKGYLLQLNLYINDVCLQNCKNCDRYYKQSNCCTAENKNNVLSVETIANIVEQTKYSSLNRINISGGNIFKHPDLKGVLEVLEPLSDIVYFRVHYLNYKGNGEQIAAWNKNIIVNFPINETIFAEASQKQKNTTVSFIIENEDMYFGAERLMKKYNINRYEIIPFFNGDNLRFFEENVYLEKDDIFLNKLSMREIFRNQKLNSNFFGNLYVFADGTVKASKAAKALGNINTQTLLELLGNEMIENTAWRKIRQAEPCNNCLYQFICPSPSYYEAAISKTNLCYKGTKIVK